ncbi:MAG: hypothetical protein H6732_12745 [Alphaproteobacteria bacterium]|nr:hypothetical protein [Alphaproteobacteria bacterium]
MSPPPPPRRDPVAGWLQVLALAVALLAWGLGGDGPARLDHDLAYRPWFVHRPGVWPVTLGAAALFALGGWWAAGRRAEPTAPDRSWLLAAPLALAGWALRPRQPGGDYPGFADLAVEAAGPGASPWAHPTEPGASLLHGLVAGQAWRLDPALLRDGFELPSSVAGLVGLAWVLGRGQHLTHGRPLAWLALWLPTGLAAVWWGDAELYAWPMALTVGMLVEGSRAPASRRSAAMAPVLWGLVVSLHLLGLLLAPAALLVLAGSARRREGRALLAAVAGLAAAAAWTAALLAVAGVTPTSIAETLSLTGTRLAWRQAGEAGPAVRLDAFALLLPWALGALLAGRPPHLRDPVDRLLLVAGLGPALIAVAGRSTLAAGGDWNLWAFCLVPLGLLLARRLLGPDGAPRWSIAAWSAFAALSVAPWILARALR